MFERYVFEIKSNLGIKQPYVAEIILDDILLKTKPKFHIKF